MRISAAPQSSMRQKDTVDIRISVSIILYKWDSGDVGNFT
jgi:hypothetical protein